MSVPIYRMEVERIENLVRPFGWELEKWERADRTVRVTFIRTLGEELVTAVTGVPSAGSPSPPG